MRVTPAWATGVCGVKEKVKEGTGDEFNGRKLPTSLPFPFFYVSFPLSRKEGLILWYG